MAEQGASGRGPGSAGAHGARGAHGVPTVPGIPEVAAVIDEGRGNSAYLVDLGDGRAFAADTHLHADFMSGAVQLASDDVAQVLASASGER